MNYIDIDAFVQFLARVLSTFLTGTKVENLIRTSETSVTAYELHSFTF
jgi:uncharacterized protein YjaG (DUF416 family)